MRRFFTSFILLVPFMIVTVATSVRDLNSEETNIYSVTSNCDNASFTTGQISVQGDVITSPAEINFMNLGFPKTNVRIGQDATDSIAPALTRACYYSSGQVSGGTVSSYACYDNNILKCTVNLTHL